MSDSHSYNTTFSLPVYSYVFMGDSQRSFDGGKLGAGLQMIMHDM